MKIKFEIVRPTFPLTGWDFINYQRQVMIDYWQQQPAASPELLPTQLPKE